MFLAGLVAHIGFGRLAEEIFQRHVYGFGAVVFLEGETHVVGRFAHVHGRAFAVGNAADSFDSFFSYEQPHAFLAFVADDFLGGQCRVADGQRVHVDAAAGAFNQLRQAVQVSACAVVVYGDYRGMETIGLSSDSASVRITLAARFCISGLARCTAFSSMPLLYWPVSTLDTAPPPMPMR